MIHNTKELQRAKRDLKNHSKQLTSYLKQNPASKNPIIPTMKARIRIIEAQIEHYKHNMPTTFTEQQMNNVLRSGLKTYNALHEIVKLAKSDSHGIIENLIITMGEIKRVAEEALKD